MTRDPVVVVIGAGIAGICVWDHLRRAGCNAVLLDAGPSDFTKQEPMSSASDHGRWEHLSLDSSEWTGVFAVGGRTNVWGGWCSRFSNDVFERWRWPVPPSDLIAAYEYAEAWLNTTTEPLPQQFAGLFNSFGPQLSGRTKADEHSSPWLDALCEARIQADTNRFAIRLRTESAKAVAVDIASSAGVHTINASHFVLAASPFETTRILMASGSRHPGVGVSVTDHLTLGFTLIERKPRASGYEAALIKSGNYAIEIVGPLVVDEPTAEMLSANDVSVESGMSSYSVHALGEQRPRPQQRITTDHNDLDTLGRPRLRFKIACDETDNLLLKQIRSDCLRVVGCLKRDGMQIVELPSTADEPSNFHPSGGAVMGPGEEYPTDCIGRLREWNNVWIADASTFPSSGNCHPTLTIVALAKRLAESLLESIT